MGGARVDIFKENTSKCYGFARPFLVTLKGIFCVEEGNLISDFFN